MPHQLSAPIRDVFRAHWVRLLVAVVLMSASACLELVPHLVVFAATVEIFAQNPDTHALFWLAGAAFASVVLRVVLLGAGLVLSHAVAFRVMRELRLRLTAKLARVPLRFFHERTGGDLKKVIVDDVASFEAALAHNLPELASGLIVPVLSSCILFWSEWRMGALALAIVPVALAVQAVTMRGYGEAWKSWHAAEARANGGVLEFIRGIAVLKAFNRDASSLTRVRDGIYGIRDLASAMTRRSMAGYAVFFSLLSGNLLVVLPSGLAMHLSGTIGREQLVLFVALGTGLLMPLIRLMFLFGSGQRVAQAIARVREVARAEELEAADTGASEPAAGLVRFDRVVFTYPGREQPALDRVSFELAPATTTAIVGASGAGKTTLLNLLVRAYDPDDGVISIGDVDLRALTGAQRTTWVSHVSQDTTLFDGSVADNLRLAKPDASATELESVARAAHAHDFIAALPQGYETPLGDRGSQLSGGERQRLAIARALLKDAPIILLDEITANVDADSERGIQEGIVALSRGRTVLIVAHRLRTVAHVDRIIVMDRGRLVDHGRHGELLERCPSYEQLWRAQEQAEGWTIGGRAAC